ncbi:hypothetical protein CRE_13842 [Caenorhabditis remanei]|uniref:Uncharacterized protein n=1 Tax=Caenorhabditis remanei TaxID=31234 RepID=E3NSX0_CAERE|nr:hypothetical protein CRE_13842 [Caenorhabditis remanei]
MASALIKGCEKKNFVSKNNIVVSVQTEKSAEKWRKQGYENVFTNTLEMLEKYPTAVYIICVKPQVFEEVVSSWPVNSRPKFILSVMAGVPLKTLSAKVSYSRQQNLKRFYFFVQLPFVSGNTTIIRLMPNVASSIGAGASTMCYERSSTIENQEIYINMLASSLSVWNRPDYSGNVAFIPAMGSTLKTQHFGFLKDKVCSPGGTTIEGVRTLEKNGFRSAVMEAVIAASSKADDMAKATAK